MKKLSLFVFLILSSLSYSQSISMKDNSIWLDKLDSITERQEKLNFIIQKIKSDSISEAKIEKPIYIIDDEIDNASCKILFSISKKKKSKLIELNKIPNQSSVFKYLNSENVDEIIILRGLSSTALFGSHGKCGAVNIILNKKAKIKI